jgi:hypothetical protein
VPAGRPVQVMMHPTATLSIGSYELDGVSQTPGFLTVSVPGLLGASGNLSGVATRLPRHEHD